MFRFAWVGIALFLIPSAHAQKPLVVGKTYGGYKLLSVPDSGVTLSKMPVEIRCPATDELDSHTREIAGQRPSRDVRVVSQFTIRADGALEGIAITQTTERAINDAVMTMLQSCQYRPALSTAGEQVAARVEWTLRITFAARR